MKIYVSAQHVNIIVKSTSCTESKYTSTDDVAKGVSGNCVSFLFQIISINKAQHVDFAINDGN